MKIKTAIVILREILYMVSVFRKYSGSLARGRYYQYNCFRAFSLDTPEAKKSSFEYFNRNIVNKRMMKIAQSLNKIGFFKNTNRKSTGEYEGIYVSNNYDKVREVKLFSFENSKILTICTSADEVEKQMKQYELLCKAYNMPPVKKNEKYENSYEISMVDIKSFDDERPALENICQSTVAYNPEKDVLKFLSVKELIEFSYDEKTNSYLQKIADKIDSSLMELKIPLCLQHGDLSKENLIYGECGDKTDFWWIDWEHAMERVFFYDLFFYIINPAFYDDMKPFESYISGEADDIISNMFEHFGLDFDAEKRFDIFLIFAIIFLKERVCEKSGLLVVKKYFELIEKMELLIKGDKKENEA